jgi:hypothetical protein
MAALNWNLDRWSSSVAYANTRDGISMMAKLVLPMTPSSMPSSTKPADWARAFVTDPAYQLK